MALTLCPEILSYFFPRVREKVIFIAGTNGKTTTSMMIRTVLEKQGKKVIHNESGANLANGIVSAFILASNLLGKVDADYAIFEVDEATLPRIIFNKQKLAVVLLNLFRDQLDRYGEVDIVARKWNEALGNLGSEPVLILNSDDPQIAELGNDKKTKVLYFGLEDKSLYLNEKEHATDSIFCLNCGRKLTYEGLFFSHLGHWYCTNCGRKRPKTHLSEWPKILEGIYNRYNTLAAVLTLQSSGFSKDDIQKGLAGFKPAFGRQEEFAKAGKKIKIFLAKNPAGFNEALRTVLNVGAKKLLLVLNDRVPDGRDVSWIWDVDFEMIPMTVNTVVSGDRVYDLALRMKYSRESKNAKLRVKNYNSKFKNNNLLIEENLKKAIKIAIDNTKKNEALYILATYSAMLEVRKILVGRKIL